MPATDPALAGALRAALLQARQRSADVSGALHVNKGHEVRKHCCMVLQTCTHTRCMAPFLTWVTAQSPIHLKRQRSCSAAALVSAEAAEATKRAQRTAAALTLGAWTARVAERRKKRRAQLLFSDLVWRGKARWAS